MSPQTKTLRTNTRTYGHKTPGQIIKSDLQKYDTLIKQPEYKPGTKRFVLCSSLLNVPRVYVIVVQDGGFVVAQELPSRSVQLNTNNLKNMSSSFGREAYNILIITLRWFPFI
jgi:hypothetical protein